jgi:hypothetical protein
MREGETRFATMRCQSFVFRFNPNIPVELGFGSRNARGSHEGVYFFNKLVWLATQSHFPLSKIQVSVNLPVCS